MKTIALPVRPLRWPAAAFWRSIVRVLLISFSVCFGILSFTVRWTRGYWPLTLTEWNYHGLLVRQTKITSQVDDFWIKERSSFDCESKSWESLQKQLQTQILSLRHDYEIFIQDHPDHVRSMISYGTFLEGIGQSDAAIRWWQRALAQGRDNPQLLNNLAHYYGHYGHPSLAIQLYESASRLNPRDPILHFNLGNMYYLFRKEAQQLHQWNLEETFANALIQFRLASECDPSNFEYASSYAETFYGIDFALNNRPWDKALKAWENCLNTNLQPQQRDFVQVHLVRLNTYQKRPFKALQHYSEIRDPIQRKIARRILERVYPQSLIAPVQV